MNTQLKKRQTFIINVLYFVLAAALLYFSFKYVLFWIMPFIFGFIVALLLRPAIRFTSKKTHLPQKLMAVILTVLFYSVVGLLLVLLGIKLIYTLLDGFTALPSIYESELDPLIRSAFDKIQELIAKLDPNMVQILQNTESAFADSAASIISGISTQVIKGLTSTVTSLPSFLLAVLLSIISSVFFVMDYRRITRGVVQLMPDKLRAYTFRLKKLAVDIGLKYVKSYLLLMSVTFIELSIGFLILGLKNAIGFAALIAFIDLLPVLGTGGVVIPWIVIEFVKGHIPFATGLLVLYVIITVIRNILEPKIIGQQIGIHPLAMLMSMYVGLQIFGFIGIFVLPILLVVIKSFYDNREKEIFEAHPEPES